MSSICVGNDVVDLSQPRTVGRSADERFLGRILSPVEADVVRQASDPDLELWTRWAAKEAAFKVVSKLIGSPPPFVHRAFEVGWEGPGPGTAPPARTDPVPDWGHAEVPVRVGVVRYQGHVVPVSVERSAERLHAVAFAARTPGQGRVGIRPRVAELDAPHAVWAGTQDELTTRLTLREADAVYSRASAAVRVGARHDLASLLGVAEDRVEIVCAPGPPSQRPPRVLLDGSDAEADVSLSHDGGWIAWALWTGMEATA